MLRAASLFEDYSSHHRTTGNKWCHRLGIPMIMASLFGMLSLVRFPAGDWQLDAAVVLIALGSFYYFRLGWRYGLAMLGFSAVLYLIGKAIPFWPNVAIFVAGWVLQFIGHGVYEKRNPAFMKNLVHLLVGPLWIINDLLPLDATSRQRGEAEG